MGQHGLLGTLNVITAKRKNSLIHINVYNCILPNYSNLNFQRKWF